MPEADFQALREFYILEPFDDEHRFHRPAALIAASMGGKFDKQLAFLRLHGCDEIQGYWLSEPLDPDACLAFLRDWRPSALHAAAT